MSLVFSKEITISLNSSPISIDPIYATDRSSATLLRLLHKKLFFQKRDSKFATELVEKYSFQNRSLLITLKKVQYNSSRNLTSKDVLKALTRLGTVEHPRKLQFQKITKISAINDLELKIDTSLNELEILNLLSHPTSAIYDPDVPDEFLGDYSLENSRISDEQFYLKKNAYSSTNFPEKLNFLILPQPRTAFFLAKKRKIDWTKLSDFLLTEPSPPNFQLYSKKGQSIQYIAISPFETCFDKNFRYALNYAIHRELIIEKILNGQAELSHGPIPISVWGKNDPSFPHNKSLAKSYLQKSKCYPQIINRNLELRLRADDENRAKGKAIQESLQDLGLKITLNHMEKAQLYKQNNQKKGELTLLTWYLDDDSKFGFLDPLFNGEKFGGGGNRSFYNNEFVNNHLSKLNIESVYSQVVETIIADSPWVFLWSLPENFWMSQELAEFPELVERL